MTGLSAAVRVAYFVRIPNVGDLANPTLLTAITGLDVVRSGTELPHLLAIGSVMPWATPNSRVWGTGTLNPAAGCGGVQAHNVHAVRGKLTHAALRESGVPIEDVPLGDPGVLVPRALGISRSAVPRFDVGLVCHHTDRYHPVLRRMMQEGGVVDLDVHQQPHAFLATMSQCKAVLSTSLHGLIFAEALGIPNLWLRGYGEPVVSDFKFLDWFSTTARPQAAAHTVSEADTASRLAGQAELRECVIDAEDLRRSLPDLAEMTVATAAATVRVDACRSRPMPAFLLSQDNGDALGQTIAALHEQSQPIEPVICDRGSTTADALVTLGKLKQAGYRVFAYPADSGNMDELDVINDAMTRYFSDWSEPARYVVSDCRMDVSNLHPDAISLCSELLNKRRTIECAGPLAPHAHVAHGEVSIEGTSLGRVRTLEASVDAAFAVHRAGESLRRSKRGMRVSDPIDGLHEGDHR